MKRRLTPKDFVSLEVYAKERAQRRRAIIALKAPRRVDVGPWACFYFENHQTMHHQIQEMLFIEGGGAAQLKEELEAYNPLIPQGEELVATLMFEIDDAAQRLRVLRRLGGVEETAFLEVAGQKSHARPEEDVERTTPDGKTSSIHFLHFPLTPQQRRTWAEGPVVLGLAHEHYTHQTMLSAQTLAALGTDFEVPA